jgi:alpha-1,2-mannosyltransferase
MSRVSPRTPPLTNELALPLGLALLVWLVVWHGIQTWGFWNVGASDFRILREATEQFWTGQSLYALRAPHGNLNPPHFHVVLIPFTWLTPRAAFIVWTAVNLMALAISLLLILRELGCRLSFPQQVWLAIGALLFAGTAAALWTGQPSLLLMWPATLAWRSARRGHLGRSGTFVGLLISIKLFMLLFVPYWIARRQHRALLAAGVTVLACVIVGVAIFGTAEYRAWFHTLGTVDWADEPWNASLLAPIRRAVTSRTSGWDLVWLIAAGLVALLSLIRACQSGGSASIDRAFGCLLCGALLASPLGWIHYLWWAAAPIAAWLRESGRPFRPAWRAGVVSVAIAGLGCPPLGLSLWTDHIWARVIFGSAYTWGLVATWILLMYPYRSGAKYPPALETRRLDDRTRISTFRHEPSRAVFVDA